MELSVANITLNFPIYHEEWSEWGVPNVFISRKTRKRKERKELCI